MVIVPEPLMCMTLYRAVSVIIIVLKTAVDSMWNLCLLQRIPFTVALKYYKSLSLIIL